MNPNQPPVRVPFFTDSYKVGHFKQYPPDTQRIYSYFEARDNAMFPETMFVGLQALLMGYLEGIRVSRQDVDEAKELSQLHFGRSDMFNEAGWRYILDVHKGKLPVFIKAVPEGTVVPNRNVLMTIENTDEVVPWLTNWLETFLVQAWYPCTVATLSREVKKIILRFLEETGDPSLIDFKLHDFGYRGSTSPESAGIGGLAHLINFMGTDTLRAVEYASWYYSEPMAGFSIPASEHSTMTSWGGPTEELAAFQNMLDEHPEGLVACVSDSYDVFNAIREHWGTALHDRIMSRNGTLVIRPDSGDPVAVISEACDIIWEKFGGDINAKGYRVFDPHVRLIQGDGVGWYRQRPPEGTRHKSHTIEDILAVMKAKGYSADNIAFGSGGGLLQVMDRDTQKLAFKCSAIKRGGSWQDVWKDPITSHGKASKRGRLMLVNPNNISHSLSIESEREAGFITVGYQSHYVDLLEPVFKNGEILRRQTLADIRARANIGVTFQPVG